MEKCSESIGIILVLYLFPSLLIICQPQIIDSLFARSIFLLFLVKLIVGSNPAIPGIDDIVMSIFFFENDICL